MAGTAQRLKELKKDAHKKLKEHDLEGAFPSISAALAIDMDDPEALYMAGCFFRMKHHSGMAAQMFRRCVALDPNSANPWMHFGAVLHDMHHYDEAIEVWKIARKIIPNDAMVLANIGASLVQKGEFAEALNYANDALKKRADLKNAKTVKALASLGMERWADGFKHYKYLYGGQLLIRVYRQPEEPEWTGSKGQTVVIQGDQGLGDEIRYASLLEETARDCKKVILDCHPKLENALRRSFPQIEVYGTRKADSLEWPLQHEIDARCHISGLGRFYRVKDKDFPRKPYLIPDPERVEKWKQMLEPFPRPWVGLAWQGGSVATGKEYRSTLLEEWRAMINTGGTFVDLSYHDSAAEVEEYNKTASRGIVRFNIEQADYDDTLALLQNLDLAVCVPTTAMHARGAMGQSCWVLVPPWTPWEFGRKRTDLIWYPKDAIRQFRSKTPDFSETIAEMAKAYGEYLDAAGYDRPGPAPAISVHRPAVVHYSPSQQAGTDYAPPITSIANQAQGADRVHF